MSEKIRQKASTQNSGTRRRKKKPPAALNQEPVVAILSESEVPVVSGAVTVTEAQLRPYEENLPERSRTQWQFGDWESLAQLDRDILQHHPDRAKLALLAAAGHLQQGNTSTASQFTRLAQDWGCSKKLVSQVLIAVVHNSLGRAYALSGRQDKALDHFKKAVSIETLYRNTGLITQGRLMHQLDKMNPDIFWRSFTTFSKRNENKRYIAQSIPSAKVRASISTVKKGIYDKEFYDAQKSGSELSAKNILSCLFKYYKPESFIDVGCGVGTWIKTAQELGVKHTLGIDGTYTIKELVISREFFKAFDLELSLPELGRFDLAMSLEVAEHLKPDRADGFIQDICKLADLVLFSAAIPYQGGTNHINENWPEYWAHKFINNDFVTIDFLRHNLWSNYEVEWWYRQNVLLFVRSSQHNKILSDQPVADPKCLSRVHPELFIKRIYKKPLHIRYSDCENDIINYQKMVK